MCSSKQFYIAENIDGKFKIKNSQFSLKDAVITIKRLFRYSCCEDSILLLKQGDRHCLLDHKIAQCCIAVKHGKKFLVWKDNKEKRRYSTYFYGSELKEKVEELEERGDETKLFEIVKFKVDIDVKVID